MATVKTTAQAAEFLKLSEKRVRELALAGRLKGQRIGRDWLFEPEELKRFKKLDRPRGWPKGRPRWKGPAK